MFTCWPLRQSAVDLADNGVGRQSCEALNVQTVKSAAILAHLGSEGRHTEEMNATFFSFFNSDYKTHTHTEVEPELLGGQCTTEL